MKKITIALLIAVSSFSLHAIVAPLLQKTTPQLVRAMSTAASATPQQSSKFFRGVVIGAAATFGGIVYSERTNKGYIKQTNEVINKALEFIPCSGK